MHHGTRARGDLASWHSQHRDASCRVMHKLLGHLEKHVRLKRNLSQMDVLHLASRKDLSTAALPQVQCASKACASLALLATNGPASCTRRVLPGVAVLASGPRCAVNRGFDTLHYHVCLLFCCWALVPESRKKASTTRKAITFTQSHKACATLVLARIPIVEDQCVDRRGHRVQSHSGRVEEESVRCARQCETAAGGSLPRPLGRLQREQEYGKSTVTSFTLSTFVRYPSPKTGCRMSGLHTRPAA